MPSLLIILPFLTKRAFPRMMDAVGMVARVAPVAPVSTNPPAVVKAAAEMGSGKNRGWAVAAISTERDRSRPRN